MNQDLDDVRIVPVILCGGSGSRLWPVSDSVTPKQFLSVDGSSSTLLQQTMHRADRIFRCDPPVLVSADAHARILARQIDASGIAVDSVILEPSARDTAPAIIAAAMVLAERSPETMMLVLPSDHVIRDDAGFQNAVHHALDAALAGHLVTFGILPTKPETGYGYIQADAPLGDGSVRRVARFVEKPDLMTAKSYLVDESFSWNAGMFLFKAGVLLEEVRRLQPDLYRDVRAAVTVDADANAVIDDHLYARVSAISIDHAVMEKTNRAAVIPATFDWSDVGSWEAVWDIGRKDDNENVRRGETHAYDSWGCLITSENRRVVTLGVENLCIIDGADTLLVADRKHAQRVKTIAKTLGSRVKMPEAIVHRPWGHYESVTRGAGHQVKRITVNPGGRLSLQLHHHRSEHWVITAGDAIITIDASVFQCGAGESVFIPQGAVHRLENHGSTPVELIETQLGDYLEEDDIVRLDDAYGRTDGSDTTVSVAA